MSKVDLSSVKFQSDLHLTIYAMVRNLFMKENGPTVIREFRNCDGCHTILEKKICDMIINMQSRKSGNGVRKVSLYHCCHAMFKASTTGLASHFSTENSIDGVEKAGFSRADLTKKKDVCSRHIRLRERFVGKQVLFDFLHFLEKQNHRTPI